MKLLMVEAVHAIRKPPENLRLMRLLDELCLPKTP